MEYGIVIISIGNLLLTLGIFLYLLKTIDKNKDINKSLGALEKNILQIHHYMQNEMSVNRLENNKNTNLLRQELFSQLNNFNESLIKRMNESNTAELNQLAVFAKQLNALADMNEKKFDKLKDSIIVQLRHLQNDNNNQLEEMRKVVDEKLHATLEKRLGESFQLVSERLEQVHKGLGEMKTLANGVGDLKRVLSNVKTRGIWGEIQLENLLEQILTIEQYEKNVATIPNSCERVEFAIKLPGKHIHEGSVWLPIDAKFPQEDYQRLLDAQDKADTALIEECAKSIENRIKSEAKDIKNKYVCVPYTTEFAILFLPIEGLYAEVLRRPGLCEFLMQKYKIIVTGPTTLAALLNSLQIGFRTLAIEKRSSEVWSILGAVKTEFGKFGDLLEKTNKKLQEASNVIDAAARKTRTIERKLKTVEELPVDESNYILDFTE
ncbi:DNA recombination protein RmuC [Anaerosinus gibii]|uniref:DNA recombination protein RmuC n=1 Tax=Selenobaculum gibii TaxID=3054208 RepID=A0A9Y2ADU8_9FIRM|nr:DNA recombination protein RmuC [Selenobaculum gbiensis]WIW69715.1 DNA recombination protein RmuC [Selenobaculum gbiensis]